MDNHEELLSGLSAALCNLPRASGLVILMPYCIGLTFSATIRWALALWRALQRSSCRWTSTSLAVDPRAAKVEMALFLTAPLALGTVRVDLMVWETRKAASAATTAALLPLGGAG